MLLDASRHGSDLPRPMAIDIAGPLPSPHAPNLTRFGGLRPRGPPSLAGPRESPLRSGRRARGTPSPLCGQQQRVQTSRFEPHNGLTSAQAHVVEPVVIGLVLLGADVAAPRRAELEDIEI